MSYCGDERVLSLPYHFALSNLEKKTKKNQQQQKTRVCLGNSLALAFISSELNVVPESPLFLLCKILFRIWYLFLNKRHLQ